LAEQLLDLRPIVLMALRQDLKLQGGALNLALGATGEGALVEESAAMRQLLAELALVAGTQLPVLLQGETGVGKEVMAHRIHALSSRAHKGLVQINCAALPETLAESELFGHVRGAFSGAQSDRAGYLQSAHQSSLFLDEVAELSLPLQAKLLRALQSGDIQRVGSDRVLHVDIRIIAASNVDLKEAVVQGRFRADLYHRLAVYPLHIPALRERQADIEPLTHTILRRLRVGMNLQRLDVSAAALAMLQNYAWPGNVRELEHVLARASLRAASEAIHMAWLNFRLVTWLNWAGKTAPALRWRSAHMMTPARR
jgi:anaerobic nitric oxide reductase transcription regulator